MALFDQNVLDAMDAKQAFSTSSTFTLTELKKEESVAFHKTEGYNPYFVIEGHTAKIQCGPSIVAALNSGDKIEDLESRVFFTLCTFADGSRGYKAALGSGKTLNHEVVLF